MDTRTSRDSDFSLHAEVLWTLFSLAHWDTKIPSTHALSYARREKNNFVIQKGNDIMSFVQPPLSSLATPPEPPLTSPSTLFDAQHPVFTIEILRQTGLGLKLRLFLALGCLALIPTVPLALFLTGGEKAAAFLSGRNALLFLLVIFVAIVLVATWVALPVIRPIRRATRQIGHTTEEITSLAQETLTIAGEHRMGITIIAGASAKLSGRRQSIIRDCRMIVRSCHGLHTRAQSLLQVLPQNTQTQLSQQAMLQEIVEIATLANAIATGLESDSSLESLQKAMTSAQDFSRHFEEASTHLQQEARQIETASRSLL
jgi:hypothetical protein